MPEKRSQMLAVRLKPSEYEKLRTVAYHQRESMAGTIYRLLNEYLGGYNDEGRKIE